MRSILLILLLLFTHCASAASTPLRGWVLENADYPNHQGLARFFDLLKQRSGGRFEGSVLWRQDLGAQKDILPKFKQGELDFAVVSNLALTDAVPEMEVLSLPFLLRDPDHMLAVLDGEIGKDLEKSLAERGFIVLGWYNGGSRSFYSRVKALRYSTDFDKLNVRVANRDSMINMIKALHGTPSTMAFDKVGDALKNGSLDAAENDLISYEISEHYKYAPNFTFSHHNVLPEALVVSTQRWASMSETDRALVRQAAVDSALYMRAQRADLENRVRKRLEKAGVKFANISGTETFVARMQQVYTPLLKSQKMADLAFRIMTAK